MPSASVEDVKIVQDGNSLTIADSIKIIVSGQSPTRVKVSRSLPSSNKTEGDLGSWTFSDWFKLCSEKVVDLVEMKEKDSTRSPRSNKKVVGRNI